MSKYISSVFKKDDYVKLLEDLHSCHYDRTFTKGTEFHVVDIQPSGLIIENEDGLRLMNVGFMRFEVSRDRGDYLSNDGYGWYSRKH